jgi:hypothetical protein
MSFLAAISCSDKPAKHCGRHHRTVRVLPHIKRLDDGFGDFRVRVVCELRRLPRDTRSRSPAWAGGHPEGARVTDALLTVRKESRRSRGRREAAAARRSEESALTLTATEADWNMR